MNSLKNNEKMIYDLIKNTTPKPNIIKNSLMAFIIGGSICAFGEIIYLVSLNLFNLNKANSISIMYIILIVLGSVLTGFGIYDKIGRIAGAGSILPITGFSNSVTSSALDYKPEGIITGIMTNMFKLASAVISAGIISSFFVGTILYLVRS